MNTIELSAALGQAQVVENLKNFVGVDAQGAAALMTPERLAAVAGEFTGNKAVVMDAEKCISTGFYMTANSTVGLPLGVGEAPMLVFAINSKNAVQAVIHHDNLYLRLYWHGKILDWIKFVRHI